MNLDYKLKTEVIQPYPINRSLSTEEPRHVSPVFNCHFGKEMRQVTVISVHGSQS